MGASKPSRVRVLDKSSDNNNQEDQPSSKTRTKETQSTQSKKANSKTKSKKSPQESDQEAQEDILNPEWHPSSNKQFERPARAAGGLSEGIKEPELAVNQQEEVAVTEVDLGLDISSSVTGVVLLKKNSNLVFMGHVPLTSARFTNLFDKADAVIDWIKGNIPKNVKVSRIFVEANAKGYSMGFSSADTLFTLAKMNALVSYLTYKWFGAPVLDINVTSARSRIGYKNNKGDKRPVKEKVREFVLLNNPHLPFKTRVVQVGKKKGFVVPAAGIEDEIDGWIVCRGGQLLHC